MSNILKRKSEYGHDYKANCNKKFKWEGESDLVKRSAILFTSGGQVKEREHFYFRTNSARIRTVDRATFEHNPGYQGQQWLALNESGLIAASLIAIGLDCFTDWSRIDLWAIVKVAQRWKIVTLSCCAQIWLEQRRWNRWLLLGRFNSVVSFLQLCFGRVHAISLFQSDRSEAMAQPLHSLDEQSNFH